MKFSKKKREQATADAFADMLDQGASAHSREALIVRALRPEQPLNEVRRAHMRDAMLAAFDSACAGEARALAPLDAPDAATVEVLTEQGRVVMADVETISPERAEAAASEALRHLKIAKGENAWPWA